MRGYTERNYDAWLERPYVEAAIVSEQHETYQESREFMVDAERWAADLDIYALFMDSPAYADAFEAWREGMMDEGDYEPDNEEEDDEEWHPLERDWKYDD